jgi:DNA mismatch repair protein MutS2
MLLKDKLKDDAGFAYVIDELEIMSTAGRLRLMEQPWLDNPADLQTEWDNLATTVKVFLSPDNNKQVMELRHQMMELQDLRGTLHNLQAHITMDEIELFQIKQFAFHTIRAQKAAMALSLNDVLELPDLSPIFNRLDPDHTGVPTFYIYDSYHPGLAPLRKRLSAAQAALAKLEAVGEVRLNEEQRNEMSTLHDEVSNLLLQQDAIQNEVLQKISSQLFELTDLLAEGQRQMAYTDLMQAKATQAIAWQLTKPTIAGVKTSYRGIVNLRLLHRNQKQHLRYQPVDVTLQSGVCFITGANMAGKTVVLKTIGCAQLMAQFGMFVPAAQADIVLVDDVLFCIGDEQNEMNGLSSFASEIIKISDTLQRAAYQHLLILIDEPARTTNPIEGKAIVHAIGKILDEERSLSLITTHYSQLGLNCRRLRVRGFVEDMADITLSPDTINRFMDYSLLPDTSDDVPQEALRIATILGCDSQMISLAKKELEKEQH